MELQKAVEHAIDGEAILFLGSGFSFGGTNKNGGKLQIGSGLAHAICRDLGIPESDDLTISASRYIYDKTCKKDLSVFIDFLKGELECTETSPEHDTIVSLPWKRIYTTNYDNIVELSSQKQAIQRESVTITNIRYAPGRNLEQAIIHINGYVKRLNENSFFEEFKITDDNYNRDGFLQSTWKELFITDLQREKAIIFVGYSLQYDQELVRLIANLNVSSKCIFIDVPTISDDNAFKIQMYGSLYTDGAGGLADKIRKISTDYHAQIRQLELSGFEKKSITDFYSETHYSIADVVNLLMKGENTFQEEYIHQEGYCLLRQNRMAEVEQLLLDNKIVIIQSRLGNGKSIFLKCLASRLIENYHVYVVRNLDTYIEDLQLIQSIPDVQNVLLIDDYGYYMKLLKDLGRDFPNNLKLVLTCRTSININLYYDLTEKYHYSEGDIAIMDLDQMQDSEIYELVKVFNINRLWGEYDTYSTAQKKKLIRQKYEANMSKIFYLLMHSESIRNQIGAVLKVLDKKNKLKEFVILQSINSLCRLKLGYSDLCQFTHISDNLLMSYRMNPDVREIIDIEHHKFILSSSIFAQYLMQQKSMKNEMIRMLGLLYQECSINDDWIKKYAMQRKFLISRSNIKLIFSNKKQPGTEEEREIFSYYDSIKNLPSATDNPFFWLQFGITSLNLKNYNLAEIQLNNAYANADKMDDFDTYQIDTQYARLLFCNEMRTNRNKKDQALDHFYKGHDLLYKNSSTGVKLSYVLKQTSLYKEFYECYKSLMTEDEIQEFRRISFQMTERFRQYFRVREIKEIPMEVAISYREYRKIFKGTPYILPLKACDDEYNSKIRKRDFQV